MKFLCAAREMSSAAAERESPAEEEEDDGEALQEVQLTSTSTEDEAGRESIPHIGLLMAVLSSLFFSLCSLIVRTMQSVGTLEHSTLRFVGVLLPSVCLVIHGRHNPTGYKGTRLSLLCRGVLGSAGLMFQFYAFQHMPLADASVIIFSSPVFVTIFARIFLGEPCGHMQVVTIVVTLVGVALISRPPFVFGSRQQYTFENLLGALSAFSGTICQANVYIFLRKLKFLHYAVIMSSFATIGVAMSHTGTVAIGTLCLPCSFYERLGLVLLGVFSFCGQVLLTKSLQLEQAGPVSICRTVDIVFAFIWQVAFLSEVPNAFSVVGAVLVTGSVLAMGVRKWLLEMSTNSPLRRRLWMFVT